MTLKRNILLLILACTVYLAYCQNDVATDHGYFTNSVLSNGKWFKIRVSESGLHQLPYSTLRGMGLDPTKTRIYGFGGAMLQQNFSLFKYDDLPQIAAYDNGNALIFYAQGPVGWDYNASTGRFVHTQNPYSFYGYYFLTDEGQEAPARAAEAEMPQPEGEQFVTKVNTFVDHIVYEKDELNVLAIASPPGGREFYEQAIRGGENKAVTFDVPYAVDSLEGMAIADGIGKNDEYTNVSLSVLDKSNQSTIAKSSSNLVAGSAVRVSVKYKSSGSTVTANIKYLYSGSEGRFFLNWVELHPHRFLKKTSGAFNFNNSYHHFHRRLTTTTFRYLLSGVGSNTLVFDVTTPQQMCRVPYTLHGDTAVFTGNTALHSYSVVNSNEIAQLPVPQNMGKVENQNLHALHDIELLIVTNKMFLSQAYQLAQAHEQYDGLSTAVVTDEEIYNEFSSGNPDASAIRWMCKMLYEKHSGKPLRYLLLIGDGSYDNRQITTTAGNNTLITYQSANSTYEPMAYTMDDYFGIMSSIDGSNGATDSMGILHIGVGRLPANTVQEAQQMVNKTIDYIANGKLGDWRNNIIFLADDGDHNLMHTWQADSVATQLKPDVADFYMQKMYLEAYQQEIYAAGERYPIAKNKLDNLFKNGMLIFNYTGHGSTLAITNENMLVHTEARDMTSDNLALWVLATCSFSHYDRRDVSIAEYALLNPQGGAIAVFSATRTVFASQNMFLNYFFMHNLFTKIDGEWPRIGDAVRLAKNTITENEKLRGYDAGNRLAYSLLGDPAVRLQYPEPYKVVTELINGNKPAETDTIKALQEVEIKGFIADADSIPVNDFNGEVKVQMFDKEATVKMLNNDGAKLDNNFVDTFIDRNSTLFKGKAKVVNGQFTINMMVPKDIHYNYGTGKLLYYASDTTNYVDANGYEERFIIGGSMKNAYDDNQGPQIDIYLNSTAFRNGDKVNNAPVFLAFMNDPNGINTAGSGIGHDLMLTIDNDIKQSYNLNDYYITGDSYKEGTVTYLMPQLADGKHSLTFRSWDLFNNSTTKSLDFVVQTGIAPRLINVNVYPNPVLHGQTLHIAVTHDRPDAPLHTTLTIYDLQGRKIYAGSQNSGNTFNVDIPTATMTPGAYIYRLEASTINSGTSSQYGKIIVK